MSPTPPKADSSTVRAAIVDHLELFRIGIENVLALLDVHVVTSSSHSADVVRAARRGAAELLIVGRSTDLKHQLTLREAKKGKNPLKVVIIIDSAHSADVARLLSMGADALLLRTVKADELREAVEDVLSGERVVAPALASTSLGRIGPMVGLDPQEAAKRSGLSPKELEVLAVLAEGATYHQIAEALIVTQATVKTHLVHIYAKLGVRNREQAIARALALGLLG